MIPKIHNKYEIEVIDTKTGDKKHYETYNTVTENYRKRLIEQSISSSTTTSVFYGSGTTAPTTLDTGLEEGFGNDRFTYQFDSDGYSFDETTNIITLKRTNVIETTEHVGKTFAEIGLGTSYTNIISRALFTDSEGNPMPIGPKTDTEIYNITVTVFLQLPNMSNFEYAKGYSMLTYATRLIQNNLGFSEIRTFDAPNDDISLSLKSYGETKIQGSSRLSKTAFNGYMGVNAFPKMVETNSAIMQKFPNPAFPAKTFTNVNIGTGDGTNKRFGLSTPFYDEGTLSVMVNGSAVPYTMLNKCERFPLNYCGMDNVYGRKVRIYEVDSNYENPVEIFWDNNIEWNFPLSDSKYYLIDLGEKVNVTHLRKFYTPGWFYQNDSGEFVAIGSSTLVSGSSYVYKLDEPIKAQFWRFYTGSYQERTGTLFSEHNIELETAPQNSDTVTATWQTSIPSKNENLEYEFTYTFDL